MHVQFAWHVIPNINRLAALNMNETIVRNVEIFLVLQHERAVVGIVLVNRIDQHFFLPSLSSVGSEFIVVEQVSC